ncbi:hypothetical protein JQC79_05955 [Ochrobactrum anthropi]|uniref:hypothetical protein n=2 Tax=Hyphomicrobiales TaxID=356 RepID=UPI00194DC38E|nr:hypothetical protein [Brucella anthropi]MBM6395300.1 hypothetical protein [Brucella anthropi]
MVSALPVYAQLVGADTAPGSSCAGFPAGATRLTADADQDGLGVALICNGSTWQPDQDAGTSLATCTTTGDTQVWDGSAWQCSSAFTPDVTPDAFDFTNQTNVAVNSTIQSNIITITGINAPAVVTISGQGSPRFRIQSGSWVTSGMINNGQTLQLQLTTGAYGLIPFDVTVVVGATADPWTVTTLDTGCVGPSYGGYCWYAGAVAGNCDTACASRGGCAAAGITYGAASTTNCATILNGLSLGSGGVTSNGPMLGVGCFYSYGMRWRDVGPAANCAASDTDITRACACNS